MRCAWCGSETSTRKDGRVFFCVKCNKPLVFELEDDYAEVVRASDFRLPQQPLQRQQQQQPQQQQQQQHRQQPQKRPQQQQQERQQEQPQQQLQLRAQQPQQRQQQPRERGQATLSWWWK